jgi:hypothetical protein
MEVRSRLDSGHGCERCDIASDDVVWPEAACPLSSESTGKADAAVGWLSGFREGAGGVAPTARPRGRARRQPYSTGKDVFRRTLRDCIDHSRAKCYRGFLPVITMAYSDDAQCNAN